MEDISALQGGKLGKGLKKFLIEQIVEKGKEKEALVVVDAHLGAYSLCYILGHAVFFQTGRSISKKLSINVNAKTDSTHADLWRGIRSQLAALLDGLDPKDLSTMSLGLSHSLSRCVSSVVHQVHTIGVLLGISFKLKFSPDKVDTMVVQAIALLDDLDKEINVYSMRVKVCIWELRTLCAIDEQHSHRNGTAGIFLKWPKLSRTTLLMQKSFRQWVCIPSVVVTLPFRMFTLCGTTFSGFRTNAASTSFAALLPEDLEATLKAAAEISMGTEISDSDITHIHSLCDQVIAISGYREQLAEYLRNRMSAIAPNLTALVGELVGARLISHAGSLLNLAKHPASTVQILGAEKALFRALKTKHDTPKYGLIYHASSSRVLDA